jgi:hypothetical protein
MLNGLDWEIVDYELTMVVRHDYGDYGGVCARVCLF